MILDEYDENDNWDGAINCDPDAKILALHKPELERSRKREWKPRESKWQDQEEK